MILFLLPLAVIGSVVWLRRRSRRDESRLRADSVATAIDMVVAVIRAGGTPFDAVECLRDNGPRELHRDILLVSKRLEAGERLGEALRDGSTELRALFDVLATGERLGVPLESLLFQLSIDARAVPRRADEESARRLPVRLSLPLVLCTLPSFVLLVIVPVLIGALQQLQL